MQKDTETAAEATSVKLIKVVTKRWNAQEVRVACRAYVKATNTTKGTNMDLKAFCKLVMENVRKLGPTNPTEGTYWKRGEQCYIYIRDNAFKQFQKFNSSLKKVYCLELSGVTEQEKINIAVAHYLLHPKKIPVLREPYKHRADDPHQWRFYHGWREVSDLPKFSLKNSLEQLNGASAEDLIQEEVESVEEGNQDSGEPPSSSTSSLDIKRKLCSSTGKYASRGGAGKKVTADKYADEKKASAAVEDRNKRHSDLMSELGSLVDIGKDRYCEAQRVRRTMAAKAYLALPSMDGEVESRKKLRQSLLLYASSPSSPTNEGVHKKKGAKVSLSTAPLYSALNSQTKSPMRHTFGSTAGFTHQQNQAPQAITINCPGNNGSDMSPKMPKKPPTIVRTTASAPTTTVSKKKTTTQPGNATVFEFEDSSDDGITISTPTETVTVLKQNQGVMLAPKPNEIICLDDGNNTDDSDDDDDGESFGEDCSKGRILELFHFAGVDGLMKQVMVALRLLDGDHVDVDAADILIGVHDRTNRTCDDNAILQAITDLHEKEWINPSPGMSDHWRIAPTTPY
jgi:hypothetical protein